MCKVFVKTICFVRHLFMCENKIVLLVNKIVLLVKIKCTTCKSVEMFAV